MATTNESHLSSRARFWRTRTRPAASRDKRLRRQTDVRDDDGGGGAPTGVLTEKRFFLLPGPADGVNLPFGSSDAESSRNQDAASGERGKNNTLASERQVWVTTEEELLPHPEPQSFCHASWYFTGSSCRVLGSRHAESMY